jgi:hypothetical protein
VLKATKYLVEELVTSLKIASRDYEIVVVGHSLGGACAALFACFLNYTLANVRAIAFAPPPCLSKRLCDSLQQSRVVTSVVFRDDLIPRLSFQNAQNLLKNLAESRSDWQHYWQQDKREYLLRAKLGWPPRNRIPREILTSTLPESTTSSNSSTSTGPEIELKDMSNGSDNVVISQPSAEEVAAGLTWACPKCTFANALPSPKCEICGTSSPSDVVSVAVALPAQPVPVNSNSNANANTSLWGKLTNVVGWGDEASAAAAAASEEGKKKPEKTRAKAVAVTAIVSNPALKPATGDAEEEKEAGEPTPNATDDAHADLYLPGAIIHIYVSQCEYKAVYLDPNHDVLTNIQLHKHVIDDHRGKAYVAALQTLVAQTQITTVLQKTIDFKEFTPFDSTAFCECCESDFTWNSTTHSVPQQSADRHNCHNCGRLVCTSCSETHRQLAHLGIAFSLRVCDTCVNGNAIPLFPM